MDSQYFGKKFNRWTVLSMSSGPKREKYFLCRCDCGKEKTVSKYNVLAGLSKSCGCFSSDRARERRKTHGMSASQEYSSWRHMIDRCNNKKHRAYRWYGAAGITVCSEWEQSFDAFFRDVGKSPGQGWTIDRIDSSKGYFPGNVRWADWKTQSSNKKPRANPLGVRGISHSGRKFRAYGKESGRHIHLGVFETVAEAIAARKAWERHHGVTEFELLDETRERLAA